MIKVNAESTCWRELGPPFLRYWNAIIFSCKSRVCLQISCRFFKHCCQLGGSFDQSIMVQINNRVEWCLWQGIFWSGPCIIVMMIMNAFFIIWTGYFMRFILHQILLWHISTSTFGTVREVSQVSSIFKTSQQFMVALWSCLVLMSNINTHQNWGQPQV